jgi:hypothetical protein
MNRKEELALIIKALKIELYDCFMTLNNEKNIDSLNGISRAKELLTNYENAKIEFNKLT